MFGKSIKTLTAMPSALVSVYALSPDAPDLNIFLNDANIAASLPFGSYTLYNGVASGTAALKAQTASQNVAIDSSFPVTAGNYYSVFLVDSFHKIKPVFLEDNFVAPPTDSTAYFRFFNFSPGAPAVTIIYSNADTALYKTVWQNRSFTTVMADSVTQFIQTKTGSYNFVVLKSNSTDTLAKFAGKDLTTAGDYTLLLEGMFTSADGTDTTLQLGIRLH